MKRRLAEVRRLIVGGFDRETFITELGEGRKRQ
jgi:hypothetical protein